MTPPTSFVNWCGSHIAPLIKGIRIFGYCVINLSPADTFEIFTSKNHDPCIKMRRYCRQMCRYRGVE